MTEILIALSMWLHTLGTIVFIGYYVLLSLIYLPVLAKNNTTLLSEISRRSRRWMYGSLLIFIITGTYLTFADPNYLGFANFGNLWGILMLVKHVLILGMIAMGFWFNAILRVGPMMSSNSGSSQALARFRSYSNLMAISGVLVLLLTTLAQIE
jgi:Predicted integral membrane protein